MVLAFSSVAFLKVNVFMFNPDICVVDLFLQTEVFAVVYLETYFFP